jgi:hypothetical protein
MLFLVYNKVLKMIKISFNSQFLQRSNQIKTLKKQQRWIGFENLDKFPTIYCKSSSQNYPQNCGCKPLSPRGMKGSMGENFFLSNSKGSRVMAKRSTDARSGACEYMEKQIQVESNQKTCHPTISWRLQQYEQAHGTTMQESHSKSPYPKKLNKQRFMGIKNSYKKMLILETPPQNDVQSSTKVYRMQDRSNGITTSPSNNRHKYISYKVNFLGCTQNHGLTNETSINDNSQTIPFSKWCDDENITTSFPTIMCDKDRSGKMKYKWKAPVHNKGKEFPIAFFMKNKRASQQVGLIPLVPYKNEKVHLVGKPKDYLGSSWRNSNEEYGACKDFNKLIPSPREKHVQYCIVHPCKCRYQNSLNVSHLNLLILSKFDIYANYYR